VVLLQEALREASEDSHLDLQEGALVDHLDSVGLRQWVLGPRPRVVLPDHLSLLVQEGHRSLLMAWDLLPVVSQAVSYYIPPDYLFARH
jgi:hypothetical protein